MKDCRQKPEDEFERGKLAGFRLALAFMEGAQETRCLLEAGAGRCPECFGPLTRDSHACDRCGWVRGTDNGTKPSSATSAISAVNTGGERRKA
jgi:hypothetical protein